MNVTRLELVLRFAGGALAGAAAWEIGRSQFAASVPPSSSIYLFTYALLYLLVLLSFALAFALTPRLTTRPFFWLLHRSVNTPITDIAAAAGGLAVGLLLAVLLAWPLSLLPYVGGFLPIVASVVLGYLGIVTVLSHKREVFQVLRLRQVSDGPVGNHSATRVLVDTSAIIDGRIADIGQTGFLPGTLAVPKFVLHELQRIADSSDAVRRGRGRRGLDVLDRLKKNQRVPLELMENELEGGQEVDAELVRLARLLKCPIITTDYNLNRVAGIQGVPVLNVNELTNAVKSVVLPGEEMTVRIIQEGKEYGQGVGYLQDGTMVVVENGRQHLEANVEVVVMRVLQTAAGRMVFAQMRTAHQWPGGFLNRTAGAIVVAAGASRRMGFDKLWTELAGKMVLTYSLEQLVACGLIPTVALVVAADRLAQACCLTAAFGQRVTVCVGGALRRDSVAAGLAGLPDCEWVLIHDAARPFLTADLIARGLDAAQETGAAVAAVPARDTLKRVVGGIVVETPPRAQFWQVQTPQIFRRDLLSAALRLPDEDVTDEATLVERLGGQVRVFRRRRDNWKITTPADLAIRRGAIRFARMAERGLVGLRSPRLRRKPRPGAWWGRRRAHPRPRRSFRCGRPDPRPDRRPAWRGRPWRHWRLVSAGRSALP